MSNIIETKMILSEICKLNKKQKIMVMLTIGVAFYIVLFLIWPWYEPTGVMISLIPARALSVLQILRENKSLPANMKPDDLNIKSKLIVLKPLFGNTSKPSQSSIKVKDRVLLITVAVGDYWYKPLVKANRDNYCVRHGYDCLFVEKVEREDQVAIYWSKMKQVIKNLDENSPYEWILLTDVDSYIMNLDMNIPKLIEYTFSDHDLILNKKYFNSSESTDLIHPTAESFNIMVSVDSQGINVGTMLFRNTNITRHLMNEMWSRRKDNGKTIPKAKAWPEQGVLIHLCQIWPELMNQHMALVHQRVFNSYGKLNPKQPTPNHQYESGDFLVHFPGRHKKELKSFTRELIKVQPELKPVAVKHNFPV